MRKSHEKYGFLSCRIDAMQGLKARERTLDLNMTVSEYLKELVLWDLEHKILDKKELIEKCLKDT